MASCKIYVDFRKLNVVRKKILYPLSFTYEVLNIVVGPEDVFLGYN
jgi:hypothetical protein